MSKNTITTQTVQHIATLANFHLTDSEVEKYVADFQSVLGYFTEIGQLDLDKVSETSQVTEEKNITRPDEVSHPLTQEESLMNGPETHEGYYVVPFILEKKDEDAS